jgi:hypothetical protein
MILTSDGFYRLIGEFCVQFEEICFLMEECACNVLNKNGLKNDRIQKVLLAGLTAEPLQRMLRALLMEHFKEERYKTVIAVFFRDFEKLTSMRNSIVHGKWNPPIDDENWRRKDNAVLSRKLKTSKRGEESEYLKYRIDDFQKYIDECKRLQMALSFINYLCSYPDKLEKYFDASTGNIIADL